MNALIIYHANCLDGFTSAWIAESACSQAMDTTLVPAQYGEEPPYDQMDHDTQVYIVDFSYPPAMLRNIADECHSVTVLDHHKTAFENLVDFKHPRVRLILDANRSGAGICWTFFNGTKAMPDLVAIVQDRDLWRFKYPNTKAVTEAMYQREWSLEAWDAMADMDVEDLAVQGEILLKAKERDIASWIKQPVWQDIGGYVVPCLNLPAKYSSDAAHELCKAYTAAKFAATYQDKPADDGQGYVRLYSLRSQGFDVSAVAKLYGGGGHNNAAGFKVRDQDITPAGPGIAEEPADIEWDSPLEEAQHKLKEAMALIAAAMEGGQDDS